MSCFSKKKSKKGSTKTSDTPPVIPLPEGLSHHASRHTSTADPISSPPNGPVSYLYQPTFPLADLPSPHLPTKMPNDLPTGLAAVVPSSLPITMPKLAKPTFRQKITRKARYVMLRRPLLNAIIGRDLAGKVKPILRVMARPETAGGNMEGMVRGTELPGGWRDRKEAKRKKKAEHTEKMMVEKEEEAKKRVEEKAEAAARLLEEKEEEAEREVEAKKREAQKALDQRQAQVKSELEETRAEAEQWLAGWGKRNLS